MNKLKHTPGPWRGSDGHGYIFADRVGGSTMTMQQMTVANIRGWGCLQYHGDEIAIVEQKANEELISCAPEMLDQLIEIYKVFYKWGDKFQKTMWIIRPLIEKATGQKIEDLI